MLHGRVEVERPADAVLLDPAPGPAGELAAGNRGPADDGGDVIEAEAEDVVEHEDGPLGRGQALQHHGEGEPDAVVEGDPVGRVGAPVEEPDGETFVGCHAGVVAHPRGAEVV